MVVLSTQARRTIVFLNRPYQTKNRLKLHVPYGNCSPNYKNILARAVLATYLMTDRFSLAAKRMQLAPAGGSLPRAT
jgi:hypothetical protein